MKKKDSVVINDVVSVHSDSSKSDNEIVIDFGDKKMNIPYSDSSKDNGIYIIPNNPNDYFTIDENGEIHTNAIPKSVTIKGKQAQFNYNSLADHSKINTSDVKDQNTEVRKVEKVVDKQKSKTTFEWWWFLLIIPAYLIVKYRKGIKSLLVHLVTGL